MIRKSLKEALRQIKQASEANIKNNFLPPFCFVVGAGISYPQVPLSVKIEEICKDKFIKRNDINNEEKDDRLNEIGKLDAMARYFEMIYEAYPNPIERWDFFNNMIKDKEISAANLLLVNLLREKQIASIVVTPNFDDFLVRALYLFQTKHVIMDHPKTIKERFDLDRTDIQGIYVHGSYLFLDICNIRSEVLNRAREMGRTLSELFNEYPPIVIGYSGWEKDCIMKGIKKLFASKGVLAYNIYWFCYKESDLDGLPNWLKSKKNESKIVFITPEKDEDTPEKDEEYKLEINEESGVPELNKIPSECVLSAVEVFGAFHDTFKVSLPECLTEPVRNFETLLKNSFPLSDEKKSIYPFHSAITNVHSARSWDVLIAPHIENLISLRSTHRRQEALEKSLYLTSLPLREAYIDTILKVLESFPPDVNDNRTHLETIENIFENLFINNKCYFEWKAKKIEVLISKAKIVGNICTAEKALKIFKEIAKDYCTSKELEVQILLFHAFMHGIKIAQKTDDRLERITFFESISSHYFKSPYPLLHNCVVKSLYQMGVIYRDIDNIAEAMKIFNKVVSLYGRFDLLLNQRWIAKSLIEKGIIHRSVNELKAAHDSFNKVLADYKNSQFLEREEVVTKATNETIVQSPMEKEIETYMEEIQDESVIPIERLNEIKNNLTTTIENLKSGVDELYILGRFLDKYRNREEATASEIIAKTLIRGGQIVGVLEGQGDLSDYSGLFPMNEIDSYSEVIIRLWKREEPQLIVCVIDALNKKISVLDPESSEELANAYYHLAQKYKELGNSDESLENLENALYYGYQTSEHDLRIDFSEYQNSEEFKKIMEDYKDDLL